jgi:uncharacterized caspase-like protein
MSLRLVRLALAALVLLGGATQAQPAKPKILALVVGMNRYTHLLPLNGAVNDANLLADALRAAGASEVRLLTDGQVTRQAIIENFQQLVARAAPGDWVVFTYAGHGWQEPEQMPFRHADGKDNAILLTNFDQAAPANGERIRDFEIAEMLAKVPPQVKVLFVADACHSGTLTREIDPRAKGLTYRDTPYGIIVADVRPPAPPDAKDTTEEQPNVVFAAAALDTETAPELSIGGQVHGALSWYVAAAIAGAADQNHDGVTTLAEFRSFVTTSVRDTSESRQTPDVRFIAGRGEEILPFAAAPAGAAPFPAAGDSISVWVEGGKGFGLLQGFPGINAAPRDSADLIWDVASGDVINRRLADPVAQRIATPARFSGVADKWRTLSTIYALAAKSPLGVDILPSGAGKRYVAGAQISIRLAARTNPALRYLTIINLAGDGEVQPQFPESSAEAGAVAATYSPNMPLRVQSPFGADHVVVIATADPADDLRKTLAALSGKQAASDAVRAIAEAVKDKPYALGVAQLYTGQ